MIRDPRTVVHRALITEKGTRLRERENGYLFEVARESNKIEIKQAIEAIFPVKVESVRTLRVHGKPKRMGRYAGHRPDWKKAVVTLKKGQTIELFEQV
ncbi:MAG TPA: 50S ribosomal protein L23 [Candidatus Saccharimonadales bacterium]|nr:50S ribosomal protein L23 [Candidatus Saccharimonadales bacterium]